MISVQKSLVPAYLQKGEFFLSLGCDDDGQVEVPSDTLKLDTAVNNLSDLRHLLLSLRFWIVSQLPQDVVSFVLVQNDCDIEDVMLEFVDQNPRLHTLWTIKKEDEPDRMELAIRANNLEIVKYLFKSADSGDCCVLAAKHGQLGCLKYFHVQGSAWDQRTAKAAALFGHLECLRYVIENGCPAESNKEDVEGPAFPYIYELICTVALTVAPYMQTYFVHPEDNKLWFEGLCDVPMKRKLDCLKYLREQGCMWGWSTYRMAAASGHLETLMYVHEQGCPVFEHACEMAARYGHLECLRYLHLQGVEWDEQAISLAVEYGHLNCLQYLHENGCGWVEHICCIAAQYGQFECLRYAQMHGANINRRTFIAAAGAGSIECVKYLHEQACYWDTNACNAAAANGHLQCLQYLHIHGCPWDTVAVERAALRGHVDCVRYLVESACPLSSSTGIESINIVRRLRQQNALYVQMSVHTAENFEAAIVYLEQASSV